MAEGINRVFLLGNLGADPELKMTQWGLSILKLRVATTERYQDRNGVWQDRTDWHSVVVWSKRAESLHKILAKGSAVFVEGSLRTSSYEDRDGNKRYRTEVSAQRVIPISKGPGRQVGDEDRAPTPSPGFSRPVEPQAAEPATARDDDAAVPPDEYPVDDDNLPF